MKQTARQVGRAKPKRSGKSKDARASSDIAMWCGTTTVAVAGIVALVYAKKQAISEESLFTFFVVILVVMLQFGPRRR